MHIALRATLAAVFAGMAYIFYVYFPNLLLGLLNQGGISGNLLVLSIAQISIGDFNQLVAYFSALGILLVAVSFSQHLSEKKSKARAFWHLGALFLKIVYLGLFIFIDFSTIWIGADTGFGHLEVNLDLRFFFYALMGGTIFDIVLTILDFFIAFFPSEAKDKYADIGNSNTNSGTGLQPGDGKIDMQDQVAYTVNKLEGH